MARDRNTAVFDEWSWGSGTDNLGPEDWEQIMGEPEDSDFDGQCEMGEGDEDLFKDMELDMENYNFFEEDDEEIYGMKMDKASARSGS